MRVHGFVLVHGRSVSWPASLLGGTCHQAREHLHTVSSFIWKNDNQRCLYRPAFNFLQQFEAFSLINAYGMQNFFCFIRRISFYYSTRSTIINSYCYLRDLLLYFMPSSQESCQYTTCRTKYCP